MGLASAEQRGHYFAFGIRSGSPRLLVLGKADGAEWAPLPGEPLPGWTGSLTPAWLLAASTGPGTAGLSGRAALDSALLEHVRVGVVGRMRPLTGFKDGGPQRQAGPAASLAVGRPKCHVLGSSLVMPCFGPRFPRLQLIVLQQSHGKVRGVSGQGEAEASPFLGRGGAGFEVVTTVSFSVT